MEYERKDFSFNQESEEENGFDKKTKWQYPKGYSANNNSEEKSDFLTESKPIEKREEKSSFSTSSEPKEKSEFSSFSQENSSTKWDSPKKKPRKQLSSKIKNYLILVLIAALFITLVGPSIDNKINITGAITGLFVDDYSKIQGLEGGSYFKGNKNAKVTIIEFSDFECPYCKKGWEVMKEVETAYIKTGKVKLIFKHLPLSFHKNAEPAAIASLCAGKQGKFWDYHDKIFENQGQLSQTYLKTLAGELKLDLTKFNACLRDRTIVQQVQADIAAATKAGVRGTPGFLINGELLSGAQPFSAFKTVIEKKLNS